MNDGLTADREDKEREVVCLDKSIVTHGVDNDDTNTDDGFTASRNEPAPQFRYPPDLVPKDRDNRVNSTRKEPGSPGDRVVVQDQDTDSSGNGASEEQDGNRGSLSTPSTSVVDSKAGCLHLYEKSKYDTPNAPPPYRNTLSSTPGKQMCRSNGGNREGLTPDPVSGGDKKDQWDDKEADTYADVKEEETKWL